MLCLYREKLNIINMIVQRQLNGERLSLVFSKYRAGKIRYSYAIKEKKQRKK